MTLSDFSYELPEELIAQDPLTDRASSRLMVLQKQDGSLTHRHFYDIREYLRPGDCLVLNNTKVIPARLYGCREGTGGKVEVLLLKRLSEDTWDCLVKPGKSAREGQRLLFPAGAEAGKDEAGEKAPAGSGEDGGTPILSAEITEVTPEGNRHIRFTYDGIFEEVLDRLGEMPLPPYITHKLQDKNRYQTVYAKFDGSAAAPTAGLHFTPELLSEVRGMGVSIAEVTLHVGLGTFRPVKVENVLEHHMHSEFFRITEEAAELINRTKESGGRVISVGTTSTRTMEASASMSADGKVHAGSGETDIFIYPGYEFKVIDGLITNFHLPESTLLMLVSALAGREHILQAYQTAVEERYRFFSFGDAMLII